MRKPVLEYYKFMEDKQSKYVTIEEVVRFIEKEEKGSESPLKYPKEKIYYRRTAVDNVIMTSLSWIFRILLLYSIGCLLCSGFSQDVTLEYYAGYAFVFSIIAFTFGANYKFFVGDRYFVIMDDLDEIVSYLKRKPYLERRRIFKVYPNCKELLENKEKTEVVEVIEIGEENDND